MQNWWVQNKYRYGITSWGDKPVAVDDIHTNSFKPTISIIEPNETNIYSLDQRINVRISSSGPYPLVKMDVFINEGYLGTYESVSSFSFTPSELENLRENNELRIVAYDSVYNSNQATQVFKVQ